jgi:hypothetical protein
MYPTNKETVIVGRGNVDQRQQQPMQGQVMISQAQLQQMQQQMTAMQAEIERQRQPVEKTYSMVQVQILLSCETINHVLEEFELSVQKALRLKMARDYLLKLADLAEFIKQPAPDVEPEPGMDQTESMTDDQLYEETPAAGSAQDIQTIVEPFQGQPDKTVEEEIEKINRKMQDLKKEDQIAKKPLSGIEKIKAFIGKKNVTTIEETKSYGDLPEGVG